MENGQIHVHWDEANEGKMYLDVHREEYEDRPATFGPQLRTSRRNLYAFRALLAITLVAAGFILALVSDRVWLRGYSSHAEEAAAIPRELQQLRLTSVKSLSQISLAKKCRAELELRREWRTLSRLEKQKYLDAVKCVTATPSRLFDNGSLYDDFTWTHNRYAHDSHNAAPFLPFHRRFIRTFELALRSTCGYTGTLPYWDWSLDWKDLTSAPVWSSVDGFGGNGTGLAIGQGVEYGRCVLDGAFANLQLMFRGDAYEPHCLSRALRIDIDASGMSPDAVDSLLAKPSYSSYFSHLEAFMHDVVPKVVRGDFRLFSAPNDPVFYLHHAQLDRLWWLWQQKDLAVRLHDYTQWNGDAPEGLREYSLHDTITLGALEKENVSVADIMDASLEPYCYRY